MLYVLSQIAYLIVVCLHLYFALLEMALWRKFAPKLFRITHEYADQSAAMASNQGLYNLFLVAALIIGFAGPDPIGGAFAFYGLTCVIVAGIWGAVTVSNRIFLIQAVPALVALALRVIQID